MKIQYFALLVLLFLLTVNIYAHGPEDSTSNGAIAGDIFPDSVSTREIAILGLAIIAASLSTGAVWFVTGRQMSIILIAATLLTMLTGFIHLAVGRTGEWLLLANGAGYCAIAVFRSLSFVRTSQFNKFVILGLMVYTMITFAGYFLTHNHFDVIGLASKAVEVILFIILLRELLTSNREEDAVITPSASPAI